MTSEDRRSIFRIARAILATAVLLCGGATYYLWQKYADTAPSFSDQSTGQVHALYANGLNVYISREQQFLLYGLAAAAAACLAGAVAFDAFVPANKESDGVKYP